jgi:hypothetical protein
MQKHEAAHRFSTILEGIRNQHLNERVELTHRLNMEDAATKGAQLGQYATGQAADMANQGNNVAPSLVERLNEPEGGTYAPKSVPPLAGEAAHQDLSKALEQKRASELRSQEHAQNRLFDSIGPDEIKTAQNMVPILEEQGLKIPAEIMKGAQPGSMTKTEFNNHLFRAQEAVDRNNIIMSRAKTYAQQREASAKIAAEAKKYVADMANRRFLDKKSESDIKLKGQQISQEINTAKIRMQMLMAQAGSATGVAEANLNQRIAEEQVHLDNLARIQAGLHQLETRAVLAPPTPDRVAVDQYNKDVRQALDSIGYRGKTENDVRPQDLPKLDEAMAKINPRYKRVQ